MSLCQKGVPKDMPGRKCGGLRPGGHGDGGNFLMGACRGGIDCCLEMQ